VLLPFSGSPPLIEFFFALSPLARYAVMPFFLHFPGVSSSAGRRHTFFRSFEARSSHDLTPPSSDLCIRGERNFPQILPHSFSSPNPETFRAAARSDDSHSSAIALLPTSLLFFFLYLARSRLFDGLSFSPRSLRKKVRGSASCFSLLRHCFGPLALFLVFCNPLSKVRL